MSNRWMPTGSCFPDTSFKSFRQREYLELPVIPALGPTNVYVYVPDDRTAMLAGGEEMIEQPPQTNLKGAGTIVSADVDTNASGFGAALYMAADGNFDEADADSASTMPCRALALETGTGTLKVLLRGFIRDDSWSWTPGADLYVSTTTGALTQTAPTGSGDQVQKVGFAWTATVVYFQPGDYTIVEVA